MIVARCVVFTLAMLGVALPAATACLCQPAELGKVQTRAALIKSTPYNDASRPARRGLGSAISYGAVKYPYLGFAVVSGGLTVANAAAVRATLHAREQDVLRRKKAEGKPPIDLTNEIKAAKEKYKYKLQKISSGGSGN